MPAVIVLEVAWVLFLAYWWISAIGVKKNVRRTQWRREIGGRVLAVAAIFAIIKVPGSRAFFLDHSMATINSMQGAAGVIICLAGFAVAVWARLNLGRNWGMPMSFKEGHEMVATGPYRYIRHPVYTGILVAMLGSALVTGRLWLVVFGFVAIYFAYSARTEESLMLQHFPEQYTQYKKGTKGFIPFVI